MKPNRSIPAASVIPELIYPDVRAAVAWLEAAFGFRERTTAGRRAGRRPRPRWFAEALAGHRWTFSETLADVAPETWGGETVAGS